MRNIYIFTSKYKELFHIFILFWALFALTNNGFDNSEGEFHYQVAVQIVKHGKLGFDTMQEGIFTLAPNGRTYASHEIGNTIFMLPTAFINVFLENILSKFASQETISRLQQFILSFQSGFYSSITVTTFFAILRVVFVQPKMYSFLATLSLAVTTFFWTFSRNLFDGVLCSTFLTISCFLIFKYGKFREIRDLILCFIILGFALITRLSMLLPIMTTFGYLITRYGSSLNTRVREIFIGVITLSPFIAWQCWYNYIRTGIFYKSPVQSVVYAENNALDGNILFGISGLLFSPGKSLLVYAPLVILSIFLFKKFYKEHQKEAIYTATLTILWFLLHSRLRSWYGAWGWGPRHFISILPILFLPFAVNIEYILSKTVLKITAILLGGFGFILALSSIISNWHFRMQYALDKGMLKDEIFVWGFWDSQSVDMLKGAVGNIVRIITQAPILKVQHYSEGNSYASSTINVWVNSFIYAGIPWFLAILLILPLLFLIYWSGKNILRNDIKFRH